MMFTEWLKKLCSRVWLALVLWMRPLVKWVLRRSTQLCELQRICYGTLPGAERSSAVEFSLEHSRNPDIQKCCSYLSAKAKDQQIRPDVTYYAVYAVVRVKDINTKLHPMFSGQLLTCIGSIWGYRQLQSEVEALTRVKCSTAAVLPAGAQQVEDKLRKLWDALKPDTPLQNIVSKQWQEIGFQGEDPCTDFRGMGLLGLENLLYFAETHQSAARHVLSRSCHPTYGYSFAIVGINLTHLVLTLLNDGSLKSHFYNVAVKEIKEATTATTKKIGQAGLQLPCLRQFHQVYCYAFFEFDSLWRNEKPKDIMEFNRIRGMFEEGVRARLQKHDCVLKANFVLENV